MYSEFYGLREQAFGESPDPRYLFCSSVHSRTLAELLRNSDSGLQTLIASSGLGKTTLIYAMLEQLRDRVDSAFIFYTVWSATDLLGFMLRELAIPDPGSDLVRRREAFESFLFARGKNAKPVVIVFDEAHNLNGSALKEIDALLSRAPLTFRVLLSGQTQLTKVMHTIAPPSLRDRVTAWHKLVPLAPDEVSYYVQHRLRIAGFAGGQLFTPDALEMIARESSGVPRNINTLCSHALDHGAVMQKPRIDQFVVEKALLRSAFLGPHTVVLPESMQTGFSSPAATAQSKQPQEQLPMRVSQPKEPDQRRHLAEAIRAWLSARSGVWSGTAGELHKQLQAEHATELQSLRSPAELYRELELDANALLGLGVDVELRGRPGHPRRLMLRLI